MDTFKQLAGLMVDRQELRITITKVGEDLVTITNLDFKKKGEPLHITGTPEELDEHFVTELGKPLQHKAAFSSNADKVADKAQKDSEKKEVKSTPSSGSKKPVKKAAKKAAKPAPNQPNIEQEAAKVEEQFNGFINDGKAAQEKHEYAEAMKHFEEALKLKPDDFETKKHLQIAKQNLNFRTKLDQGEEHLTNKKFQEAVDCFKEACNIFPADEDAKTRLDLATKKLDAFNLLHDELV